MIPEPFDEVRRHPLDEPYRCGFDPMLVRKAAAFDALAEQVWGFDKCGWPKEHYGVLNMEGDTLAVAETALDAVEAAMAEQKERE